MGFFSKDISTMDDLFVHTLRDIYYAEQEILKALPTMIEKVTNPQLRFEFEQHLAETRRSQGRTGVRNARRRGQGGHLSGQRWHPRAWRWKTN
jgi:hypothetical protein